VAGRSPRPRSDPPGQRHPDGAVDGAVRMTFPKTQLSRRP
jgi:hypothetical protein